MFYSYIGIAEACYPYSHILSILQVFCATVERERIKCSQVGFVIAFQLAITRNINLWLKKWDFILLVNQGEHTMGNQGVSQEKGVGKNLIEFGLVLGSRISLCIGCCQEVRIIL